MTGDQWGATLSIVVIVYVWGCLNRGWTSPVDIWVDIDCRMGGHRWCGHDDAWSEDQDDDEADVDPPMSTPAPTGPLRTPPPLTSPPIGPVPIEQLSTGVRFARDPRSTDRQQGESGMAWTRRVLESGLLGPGEIDDVGAKVLGVHPDTVRRWRRLVRQSQGQDAEGGRGQRP